MRGRITAVADAPGGRKLATIELEGVEGAIELEYWPELLEQWGADKLRGWLLHQAELAIAPEPPAEDPHAALVGEGEAAPVRLEQDQGPGAKMAAK